MEEYNDRMSTQAVAEMIWLQNVCVFLDSRFHYANVFYPLISS